MTIDKILSQKEENNVFGGSYKCTCCSLFARAESVDTGDVDDEDIRLAQMFTSREEFIASKALVGKIKGATTVVDAPNNCYFFCSNKDQQVFSVELNFEDIS